MENIKLSIIPIGTKPSNPVTTFSAPLLNNFPAAVGNSDAGVITITPAGIKPSNPVVIGSAPVLNYLSTPVRNQDAGVMTITPAGIKPISPTKSDSGSISDSMYIKDLPLATSVVAPKKITVSAVVYDDAGVIPGANITVSGISYTPTDVNGKFTLKNVDDNAAVSISFVGYKTKTYEASQLPAKIILEIDVEVLTGLEIKNTYKKTSFWWVLLLVGAVTIGGYLYTRDPKTKKIIKTKI